MPVAAEAGPLAAAVAVAGVVAGLLTGVLGMFCLYVSARFFVSPF